MPTYPTRWLRGKPAEAPQSSITVLNRPTRLGEGSFRRSTTPSSAVPPLQARGWSSPTISAYGPVEGPLTESSPQTPPSRRGRLRRELADRLLDAHHSGLVEVAIGRAADYFGPRGRNSVVGDLVFIPAVEGHRARWLGRRTGCTRSSTSKT